MKIMWILVASLGVAFSLTGQTFMGEVRDAETREPVAFANVYFEELHTGTTTDEAGIFKLENYPKRKISFQISFLGYEELTETIDLTTQNHHVFLLHPAHFDLEEVVVSVPVGKLQEENVVRIEQVKINELTRAAPVGLSEAISAIPGVDQVTTGPGIGKPVIRGLSGNRIVVYSQDIRMENQQWGDEHGLGIGEAGIGRVEVIKGPASLLYGSDALGGVLYFVEDRYADLNKMEGMAETGFHSNSLGISSLAGVKWNKNNFKMNLFGSLASHADFRVPGGDRVQNARFNEKLIKTAIGHNRGNWTSNLYYTYLKNNLGITEDAQVFGDAKTRTPDVPFQDIQNHHLSWNNTIFRGDSKLNLVLGFSDNRRKEFEESADTAALNMDLQTFSYNLKWHTTFGDDRLSLVAGTQGMYQTNENSGEELLIPDATTQDAGLFSVVNYSLPKLELQGGLRYDFRKIDTPDQTADGTLLYPALTRRFGSFNFAFGAAMPLEKMTLRANLSSGFRAPHTSELLSNGVHEGTFQFVVGDPNLTSESATQLDLSIDLGGEHFQFSANPYFNYIRNYIFLAPTDRFQDDIPVFEYRQQNARLFGGETGFHYHPHALHWLHIASNWSIVLAEDDNGKPLPLIPPAQLRTTLKAELSPQGAVRLKAIFIEHVWKMRQNRVADFETRSPDYHVVNAGVNFDLGGKDIKHGLGAHPFHLALGARNLFNVRYIDHLSRLKTLHAPNPGFNFFIELKWHFETGI